VISIGFQRNATSVNYGSIQADIQALSSSCAQRVPVTVSWIMELNQGDYIRPMISDLNTGITAGTRRFGGMYLGD